MSKNNKKNHNWPDIDQDLGFIMFWIVFILGSIVLAEIVSWF